MAPWEIAAEIATVVGTIGAIVGFGVKSARTAGRQEEHMRNIDKTVEDNAKDIVSHAKQLSDGAGNFRVIETKLDTLTTLAERMDDRLRRHCEEKAK